LPGKAQSGEAGAALGGASDVIQNQYATSPDKVFHDPILAVLIVKQAFRNRNSTPKSDGNRDDMDSELV